jgi:NAD(P)-dependent dehydrogenase (short-subunit alcohol dehydrogenase family)
LALHLHGKVALVTGAGRGIGRAVALVLAGAGADVALLARTGVQLADVAGEVTAMGRRALAIESDLADAVAVARVARRVAAELGPVAVLVNNAGVAPSAKVEATTDESWQQTLAVNLSAPFYLCRAVLPHMLAAGWGRIVNVASTAAKVGYKYNTAYVASKHGLLGLTRALAVELARQNITVNAVCPGFVDTEIVAGAVANLSAKTGRPPGESRRVFEAMSPQARLMTPQEVAEAVLYLTTGGARGVNGQSLVVDGGGVQA